LILSGLVRRAASLYPSIDLFFFELPKTAHAMGGHRMLVDPAVNGVTADTEVLAYLVY
jgi:hypothetical protein